MGPFEPRSRREGEEEEARKDPCVARAAKNKWQINKRARFYNTPMEVRDPRGGEEEEARKKRKRE